MNKKGNMEKEKEKTITASEAYTTAVGAFKMANDSAFKDINEKIIKAAEKGLFKIWVSPLSYDGFNDEIVSRLKEMGYTIEDGRAYGGLVYIRWENPPPLEVGGEEKPIKYDDVWRKRNTLYVSFENEERTKGFFSLIKKDGEKIVGIFNKTDLMDWGIALCQVEESGFKTCISINYVDTEIKYSPTHNI
jgi:hypothetical protein